MDMMDNNYLKHYIDKHKTIYTDLAIDGKIIVRLFYIRSMYVNTMEPT